MIKKDYKENICIKYSELDCNLALKPFALLNFLQDIATNNAEHSGFGYTYMNEKKYMWFVIKYHMEFMEYPCGIQDLTLYTEPRGYNKLFAYRDFEFWKNNNCIIRISSVWAIVDTESHTMILPQVAIPDNPKMKPFAKREDDLAYIKIKPSGNYNIKKEFEIRYNDIDSNGHANNGNYILWALEPLPYDFRIKHKIKTLDIVYKKEAKYGEKIVVQIEYKDDLNTMHTIKNVQNEELCSVECSWSK